MIKKNKKPFEKPSDIHRSAACPPLLFFDLKGKRCKRHMKKGRINGPTRSTVASPAQISSTVAVSPNPVQPDRKLFRRRDPIPPAHSNSSPRPSPKPSSPSRVSSIPSTAPGASTCSTCACCCCCCCVRSGSSCCRCRWNREPARGFRRISR